MSSKFLDFIKSFDSYGEPVQVSYKGDSSFKTTIGALVSLAMQGFMLAFTLTGLISLINYKNPSISQFTVLDSRDKNQEVNMDESYGEFAFGFIDFSTSSFVPCDPTICSLQMQVVSVDWSSPQKLKVHKDLAYSPVTRERNPELFGNGSGINSFDTAGLYTIDNKADVSFMNSVTTMENKFLRVAVMPC